MPASIDPVTCAQFRELANRSMVETVETHSTFPKHIEALGQYFGGSADSFVSNLVKAAETVEAPRPLREDVLQFIARKGHELMQALQDFGHPRKKTLSPIVPQDVRELITPEDSLAGTIYFTGLALLHRMKSPFPKQS